MLARPSHVARGRHQAVGRRDDPSRASELSIRRMRVSAPMIGATEDVAGIPVAAI